MIFQAVREGVGFDRINASVRDQLLGFILCAAARQNTLARREAYSTAVLDQIIGPSPTAAVLDAVHTMLSPLGSACDAGHTPLLRYLLAKGCDPTGRMGLDHSPLHIAAREGRVELILILAEAIRAKGSELLALNLAATNAMGRTPRDEATRMAKAEWRANGVEAGFAAPAANAGTEVAAVEVRLEAVLPLLQGAEDALQVRLRLRRSRKRNAARACTHAPKQRLGRRMHWSAEQRPFVCDSR